MKIVIVSNFVLNRYLKRGLKKWKGNHPKEIIVENGEIKIPDLLGHSIQGEGSVEYFTFKLKFAQAKKLYSLTSLLTDQPITMTFSGNCIDLHGLSI